LLLTKSRVWQIFYDVYPPSYCSYASSIVIDRLRNSINDGYGQAALTYVYFDYKDQQNQKAVQIVASLLKQLLCQIDKIPDEVEDMYKTSVSACTRPSLGVLTKCFIRLLRNFSTSFVVFDALDECNPEQRDPIVGFIKDLQREKARVFLTSRPHLSEIQELFLSNLVTLQIEAEKHDLRNFLGIELAKRKINKTLSASIIQTLVEKADGM
jgi:glycyl-tRNA synthetase alpha subunit